MLTHDSHDAWAHPRPRYFDIITGFEHYMSIVPAMAFILTAPIHISPMSEAKATNRRCAHIYLQILLLAALSSIEIQIALLWIQKTTYSSPAPIIEGCLLVLVSASAAYIVDGGRTRPPLPRPFISKFYYFASLMDAMRAPFLYRRSTVVAQWTLVCSVLKVFVALLEKITERSAPYRDENRSVPLFNLLGKRSLIGSLGSILKLGFKEHISIEDLPNVDHELEAKVVYERFDREWPKVFKKTEYSLATVCASAIRWDIITSLTPRLLASALSLARPLMFHHVLYVVGQSDKSLMSTVSLIASTLAVFAAHAFARSYTQSLGIKNAALYRSCLTTAIYNKMLRLQDKVLLSSSPLTVLTTDMAAIENAVLLFNDLWCAAITTFLGAWLLLQQLQDLFFVVLIPVTCYALVAYTLILQTAPAQRRFSQTTKARVSNTFWLLHHWRTLKISALSSFFENKIREAIGEELYESVSWRRKLAVFHALLRVIEPLSCTLTVAMALHFAKGDATLTTADVFTTVSLIAIMNKPIICTINGFGRLTPVLENFQRVQEFLQQPALYDGRQVETHRTYAVKMQHVVAGELGGGRKLIPNLRITFGNRLTTMIVGPVGCGKTTLLRVLAGETPMAFGNITLNTPLIAYCSQDPWLRNVSIRDNIIGDVPFEISWYCEVLKICHLERELASMPEGDSTLAGTHDCHLSVGQRQQIALARAVYSRSTMYLLDDVFSKLDRPTAHIVFQNLFGPHGYLKANGKTVIMATNIVEHLSAAHVVLQMGIQGEIDAAEDADTLVERGYLRWEMELRESNTAAPPSPKVTTAGAGLSTRPKSELSSGGAMVSDFYTKAIGQSKWNLFIGLLVVGSISDKLPHILIKVNAITKVIEVPYMNAIYFSVLAPSIIWFIAFQLWYRHWTLRVVRELHDRLLYKVLRFPIAFVSSIDAGYFVKCFFEDLGILNDELPSVISSASMAFLACVFDICLFSSSTMIAPLVLGMPAYYALSRLRDFYLRTALQIQRLELESRVPVAAFVVETVHGIQQIRTSKWEAKYKDRADELFTKSEKLVCNLHRAKQVLLLLTDFLVTAVTIVAILIASYDASIASDIAVSLGMATIFTFGEDTAIYIDSLLSLSSASSSISRIQFICETAPTEAEMEMMPGEIDQFSEWPQEGGITFSNACASYRQTKEASTTALHGINMRIQPGQQVGLSGPAGSGKSSVILTLLRFLNYTGSIKIDGIELSNIPHEVLRSRITTVPQDILELPGTVRFNLDPFVGERHREPAKDQIMIRALVEVGLWAIFRENHGLSAEVAALNLSQEQKQLLGIARAIVHHRHTKSKIVLLDELFPYLDLATERRVKQAMYNAFSDCTLLVVTQDEEDKCQMNVVAEMSQGKLDRIVARHRPVPDTE